MDSLLHDLYPAATANIFITAAAKLGFLIEELQILGLGCTLGDQWKPLQHPLASPALSTSGEFFFLSTRAVPPP
jgi:hypothetical protein